MTDSYTLLQTISQALKVFLLFFERWWEMRKGRPRVLTVHLPTLAASWVHLMGSNSVRRDHVDLPCLLSRQSPSPAETEAWGAASVTSTPHSLTVWAEPQKNEKVD